MTYNVWDVKPYSINQSINRWIGLLIVYRTRHLPPQYYSAKFADCFHSFIVTPANTVENTETSHSRWPWTASVIIVAHECLLSSEWFISGWSLGGWWIGHWHWTKGCEFSSLSYSTYTHDSGQIVHTHVHLSLSSITWYCAKSDNALWLSRWLQALRKVTTAYRQVYESQLWVCCQ